MVQSVISRTIVYMLNSTGTCQEAQYVDLNSEFNKPLNAKQCVSRDSGCWPRFKIQYEHSWGFPWYKCFDMKFTFQIF